MSRKTERDAAIRRILDARFSLSGLEALREADALEWNSARNAMGRGIYGEAMRARRATISSLKVIAQVALARRGASVR